MSDDSARVAHAVWVCSHLWRRFLDGDDRAAEVIGGAAFGFMVDMEENVAVCDLCDTADVVPMERPRVQLDDDDDAMIPGELD